MITKRKYKKPEMGAFLPMETNLMFGSVVLEGQTTDPINQGNPNEDPAPPFFPFDFLDDISRSEGEAE